MSTLIAIDPGPVQSAFVRLENAQPVRWAKTPNILLLKGLIETNAQEIVIEQIGSYGMPVGAEVFETCVWTGRFMEAFSGLSQTRRIVAECHRLKRYEVKMHLCRSMKAKDGNIRQALIDRWGGKEKAIGCKASPGPLYGMKADCWQALALGITFLETRKK